MFKHKTIAGLTLTAALAVFAAPALAGSQSKLRQSLPQTDVVRQAQLQTCHYQLRRICTTVRVCCNRFGGPIYRVRCKRVLVRVCGRHRN